MIVCCRVSRATKTKSNNEDILVNFVERKVNVIMTYPILLKLCIIMAEALSYLH